MFLPYFELPEGRALRLPGWHEEFTPETSTEDRTAYRGIEVQHEEFSFQASLFTQLYGVVTCETDYLDLKGATVSVNRVDLKSLPDLSKSVVERLAPKCTAWIEEVLSSGAGQAYRKANLQRMRWFE